MKRLYEAIEEAKRLSRSQPLGDDELDSMLESMHVIAVHGNEAVKLLAKELFASEP